MSGPQTEHVMDQRIIQILSDSFTQLLIPGICVTIPLTLISFAIGLVVAVAIALIRTAKTPVLEPLARIYVWIFRGPRSYSFLSSSLASRASALSSTPFRRP